MQSTNKSAYQVGRPRSEKVRQATLAAALELANERGYHQVSLLDIAQTAKVGRQTIYRWWPNKSWLYMEVVFDQFDQAAKSTPPKQTDLETYLKTLITVARGKVGPITIALLLEMQHDKALADQLRRYFWNRRLLLKSAVEQTVQKEGGSLKIPLDIILDMLIGTLWYRLLYQFASLDDALAHDMAKTVRYLTKNSVSED